MEKVIKESDLSINQQLNSITDSYLSTYKAYNNIKQTDIDLANQIFSIIVYDTGYQKSNYAQAKADNLKSSKNYELNSREFFGSYNYGNSLSPKSKESDKTRDIRELESYWTKDEEPPQALLALFKNISDQEMKSIKHSYLDTVKTKASFNEADCVLVGLYFNDGQSLDNGLPKSLIEVTTLQRTAINDINRNINFVASLISSGLQSQLVATSVFKNLYLDDMSVADRSFYKEIVNEMCKIPEYGKSKVFDATQAAFINGDRKLSLTGELERIKIYEAMGLSETDKKAIGLVKSALTIASLFAPGGVAAAIAITTAIEFVTRGLERNQSIVNGFNEFERFQKNGKMDIAKYRPDYINADLNNYISKTVFADAKILSVVNGTEEDNKIIVLGGENSNNQFANEVFGKGGKDTIIGSKYADRLVGDTYDDQGKNYSINYNAKDSYADIITGGKGDDLLIGGKGNDTYYFSKNDGDDVIIDIKKDVVYRGPIKTEVENEIVLKDRDNKDLSLFNIQLDKTYDRVTIDFKDGTNDRLTVVSNNVKTLTFSNQQAYDLTMLANKKISGLNWLNQYYVNSKVSGHEIYLNTKKDQVIFEDANFGIFKVHYNIGKEKSENRFNFNDVNFKDLNIFVANGKDLIISSKKNSTKNNVTIYDYKSKGSNTSHHFKDTSFNGNNLLNNKHYKINQIGKTVETIDKTKVVIIANKEKSLDDIFARIETTGVRSAATVKSTGNSGGSARNYNSKMTPKYAALKDADRGPTGSSINTASESKNMQELIFRDYSVKDVKFERAGDDLIVLGNNNGVWEDVGYICDYYNNGLDFEIDRIAFNSVNGAEGGFYSLNDLLTNGTSNATPFEGSFLKLIDERGNLTGLNYMKANISVDNMDTNFLYAPYIKEGNTMVSAKEFAKKFVGADVKWDQQNQIATIEYNGKRSWINYIKNTYSVNGGAEVQMRAKADMVTFNSKYEPTMMIHIDPMVQILGLNVNWNNELSKVEINTQVSTSEQFTPFVECPTIYNSENPSNYNGVNYGTIKRPEVFMSGKKIMYNNVDVVNNHTRVGLEDFLDGVGIKRNYKEMNINIYDLGNGKKLTYSWKYIDNVPTIEKYEVLDSNNNVLITNNNVKPEELGFVKRRRIISFSTNPVLEGAITSFSSKQNKGFFGGEGPNIYKDYNYCTHIGVKLVTELMGMSFKWYSSGNQIEILKSAGEMGGQTIVLNDLNRTAVGTDVRDHITGSKSNDTINGGAGDDIIYGGNGDDIIVGGTGGDNIFGDAGNDSIYGNAGNDFIRLGSGSDIAYGGDGSDTIEGNEGDDTLYGEVGDDILDGGSGNDTLVGGYGSDTYNFSSGFGVDTIIDSSLGNSIRFTDYTSDSATFTQLRESNDLSISFKNSTDHVLVKDFFANNMSFNTITFANNVIYNYNTVLSMANKENTTDNDYIQMKEPVEELNSGIGDDTVLGNARNNKILGGDGQDYLYGAAGNDYLDGGAGINYVDGGTGSDVYHYSDASSQLVISDLSGEIGDVDTLKMNYQLQQVTFAQSDSKLIMTVLGSTGCVVIEDYFSNDSTVEKIELLGTTLDKNHVNSIIQYGIGTDQNDTITGTNSNDMINGFSGDDVIIGGTGDDMLNGGIGKDTYVFNKGFGIDEVREMANGGAVNRIAFNDIASNDVTVILSDDMLDVTLRVISTGDEVCLKGFYESHQGFIENISFSDGANWNTNDFIQKILSQTKVGSETEDTLYGFNDERVRDTLNGASGNDTIYAFSGNDTLNGGTGDDQLDGGEGKDTYIFNDAFGQDTIIDSQQLSSSLQFTHTNSTDVTLSLDESKLHLIIKDNKGNQVTIKDYMLSEQGNIEKISFANGVIWNAQQTGAQVAEIVIEGSNEAEVLAGAVNYNVSKHLIGNAGDDQLFSIIGNTILEGGLGNDTLYGGIGNDTYVFNKGFGQDVLSDSNDDISVNKIVLNDINPNEVNVTLVRDTTDVKLTVAGTGDSIIFKGIRSTALPYLHEIKFGNGVIWNQNDIKASWLTQRQEGTAGDDVISGFNDLEIVDVLVGNGGNDTLEGGTGNDTLIGGEGVDTYEFSKGFGQDQVIESYNAATLNKILLRDIIPNEVTFTLVRDTADVKLTVAGTGDSILLKGIRANALPYLQEIKFGNGVIWNQNDIKASWLTQRQEGTAGDDVISGYNDLDIVDVLVGNGGNDALHGGAGNDILEGGTGNDTLIGGEGVDTYIFSKGFGQDQIIESYNAATLNKIHLKDIMPNEVSFKFVKDTMDVMLTINGTNDSILLKGIRSTEMPYLQELRFANGVVWNQNDIKNNWLTQKQVGTTGKDYLRGYDELNVINILYGNDGDDSLTGSIYDDTLYGENGDDTLIGARGDDTLIGGTGNDSLYGLQGVDTFIFSKGFGQDIIYTDTYNSGIEFESVPKGLELYGAKNVTTDFTYSYLPVSDTIGEKIVFTNIQDSEVSVFGMEDSTSLKLVVNSTNDSIVLKGILRSIDSQELQKICFSNGVVWTLQKAIGKAIPWTPPAPPVVVPPAPPVVIPPPAPPVVIPPWEKYVPEKPRRPGETDPVDPPRPPYEEFSIGDPINTSAMINCEKLVQAMTDFTNQTGISSEETLEQRHYEAINIASSYSTSGTNVGSF